MFYVVLVIVIVLMGSISIDPLIDWLDAKKFPMVVKTVIMLVSLGLIPAIIVGAGAIGDTFIRSERK